MYSKIEKNLFNFQINQAWFLANFEKILPKYISNELKETSNYKKFDALTYWSHLFVNLSEFYINNTDDFEIIHPLGRRHTLLSLKRKNIHKLFDISKFSIFTTFLEKIDINKAFLYEYKKVNSVNYLIRHTSKSTKYCKQPNFLEAIKFLSYYSHKNSIIFIQSREQLFKILELCTIYERAYLIKDLCLNKKVIYKFYEFRLYSTKLLYKCELSCRTAILKIKNIIGKSSYFIIFPNNSIKGITELIIND